MPRILIIEDDDSLRKLLRVTLAGLGYQVAEARNGKDGIAQNQREPADVVLTDILMPEMAGMETIMRLRREQPGVKIIAMSGGGHVSAVDYLKFAKKRGVAEVLVKPFTDQELAAAIQKALGRA